MAVISPNTSPVTRVAGLADCQSIRDQARLSVASDQSEQFKPNLAICSDDFFGCRSSAVFQHLEGVTPAGASKPFRQTNASVMSPA
ncbi:hypothetical protein DBV39_18290 [Orrella marina]|uniref:Uncharacterized protein n=1 Tax=Orrella marina TaxID=2163011 RepID=A0A2R4XNH5_9BURK|nr:hypothetical protein DBV39_18290 [Orrella marina]